MFGLEVAPVCIEVTKCGLRRHGQLSGGAQAEERGWEKEELGGSWASEGQMGWVLGSLALLQPG